MPRYIHHTLALLLLLCLALPATAEDEAPPAAQEAGQQDPAIAAIEAAGGTVRKVSQAGDELEVSFHPGGHEAGDDVMAHVAMLPLVTRLDLRQTQITDTGLAQLAGLTDVERLHLEQTAITDAGLAHLAGYANLKYLNLYDTSVSDAGLASLAGLSGLEKLYLWETEVTHAGAGALAESLPNAEIVLGADLSPPTIAGAPAEPFVTGRTVRIRLEGEDRVLSLAEVQVIEPGTGAQLQVGGTANQSSVEYGAPSQRAADGNTAAAFPLGSVTHTAGEANPYWSIDLGADKPIGLIKVFNRGDCCGDRLTGAIVEVLDSAGTVVWSATIAEAVSGSMHEFPAPPAAEPPVEVPVAEAPTEAPAEAPVEEAPVETPAEQAAEAADVEAPAEPAPAAVE